MTTLCRLLLTTLISCSTIATSGQNYKTQRQFADKLFSKNICSEINYQKLITGINSKQIENPQDFLNYCDKVILIDLKKYPDKPENYLEQIHKDVSRLLPDLQFSDFKYQIVLYDELHDGDDKFYNFAISLKSKGKTYQQTSFYELYSVSKNKHYDNKIDQQSFYKIFNKILSDNQSPYRLHEVQFYGENAILPDIFGIIALTNEQAKILHGGGVLFEDQWQTQEDE